MSDDTDPFPKRLPEFSRAVDDSEDSDWDEAEAADGPEVPGPAGNCVLRLGPEARREISGSATGRLDCSTLLLGVGASACGFLTACVQGDDASIVGLISCGFPDSGMLNSLGQTELGDFGCFIYRLKCNPRVLVCHSMAPVSPSDCHAFVESLLSLLDLDSLDVAAFCTAPLSSFQCGLPASALASGSPMLRCLRTSAMLSRGPARQTEPPAAAAPQSLEPPNLLTGLPAQLLSVCQMRRVPAVAFVSYHLADSASNRGSSSSRPDSEAMASFRAALGCEPVRFCRPSWPRDADSVMRRLCGQASAAGGLLYT